MQTATAQSVPDIHTLVPFRNSAFNGPRGQSITEAIDTVTTTGGHVCGGLISTPI